MSSLYIVTGFQQQRTVMSSTMPAQMNPVTQGVQPPGYFPAFK